VDDISFVPDFYANLAIIFALLAFPIFLA